MGIKNLKINQKSLSKLISCTLVGSVLATALSGCSNERKSILSGTVLEDAYVVTFEDGTKDIVDAYESCEGKFRHHYYSLISGIHYASNDCISLSTHLSHYEVINEEPINKYLTSDDIQKAANLELSSSDINNIIGRIVGSTPEKVNTK